MRYAADTLVGCLTELLDRIRRSDSFEAVLATYDDARAEPSDDPDEDDLDVLDPPPGPDPGPDDLGAWLSVQRVARFVTEPVAPMFVVVEHARVLRDLGRHPRVRAILDTEIARGELGSRLRSARLTADVIRRSDRRLGRRITQAVSAAVHSDDAGYGGIAYQSCVDVRERCWAVYGRTPVLRTEPDIPVLGTEAPVRAALAAASAFTGVAVPTAATESAARP